MSKTTTLTEDMTQHVLDAIKSCGGTEPSLRAFALALDMSTVRIYATARKPVIGQPYDPETPNWDALSALFATKLAEPTATVTNMQDLVTLALEKDEWISANSHRRVGSAGANLIDIDGGKMPARKSATFELGGDNESLLCFKHDGLVYRIVYQTLGYTVIRAVNEDGEFGREEVRVISNGTLNTKVVSPANMAEAIADRFSGAYAERHAKADQCADDEQPMSTTPTEG